MRDFSGVIPPQNFLPKLTLFPIFTAGIDGESGLEATPGVTQTLDHGISDLGDRPWPTVKKGQAADGDPDEMYWAGPSRRAAWNRSLVSIVMAAATPAPRIAARTRFAPS